MENLTFEQLSEKFKEYVLKEQERYKDLTPRKIKLLLTRIDFLKSIGFVENKHFRYKCNKEVWTSNVYCPTDNGGGYHSYELEGIDTTISLINPTFDTSTGNIRTFETECDFDDKNYISCSSIMDRRGYYKPITILDKIKFLWETAENCKKQADARRSLVDNTIKEYQEQYPNADIIAKKNTEHRHNAFNQNADVLSIRFPSGSYINIVVTDASLYRMEERIIKIYDAETNGLPVNEILNKFNQQVPCGVEETA
jgi:hypothetical protein